MSINLNSIIQNKRSGSSRIIKNTLELLKEVKEDERFEVCKKIVNAHRAMSGLKFIMESVKSNPRIDILIDKIEEMNSKTSENLEKIVEGKIVTIISRSHIVERGLTRAKKINVLESKPEKEGIDTAKWLEEQEKDVEVYYDAFMGYAVKNCDVVIVGADSLLKIGFINKTGTLSLALTAKHLSKEFYVAAPSYKFIGKDVEFDKNFEFINKEFVTAFIWEGGIGDDVPG
jgi:translation initiation factor eIF-2B subunit delta